MISAHRQDLNRNRILSQKTPTFLGEIKVYYLSLIFLNWYVVGIVLIRRAQVKVGLINLCKGLFSLNARIYYKLKSGT